MASDIETRTDLYEVLDKIDNNADSYDRYSSMKLFYNDMAKKAVIYKTLNEDDEVEIVAIFNPERVLIDEFTHFDGSILKSVSYTSTEVRGFDLGLGAFIDFDRLIKNICKGLGLTLSDTFATDNPTIYEDLVNICKKYINNTNQSVYFMQKVAESDPSEYVSYVPILIIVDIAIYLNNLGIFKGLQNRFMLSAIPKTLSNASMYMGSQYINTNRLDLLPNIEDYYEDWLEFDTFINMFKVMYNGSFGNITYEEAINSLVTAYADQIDTTKLLIGCVRNSEVCIIELPRECFYTYGSFYFRESGYVYTIYTINSNLEYDKVVAEGEQIQSFSISTFVTNINFNLYNKYYIGSRVSYSDNWIVGGNDRTYYILYDAYPTLTNDYEYELKFLESKFWLYGTLEFYGFFYDNNIANTVNDLCFKLVCDSKYLFLKFKNVNKTSSNIASSISRLVTATIPQMYIASFDSPTGRPPESDNYYTYVNYPRYTGRNNDNTYISISNNSTAKFDFDTSVEYELYEITYSQEDYSYSKELKDSGVTSSFTFNDIRTNIYPDASNLRILASNIGETCKIKTEEELTGYTLENEATYPNNVIDLNSFNATYPNWITHQRVSTQPVLNDENQVVENQTTSTYWLSLNVGEPSNQAEAQDGDVENVDLDALIRDIDKAEEGDDSGDDVNDNDDSDGSGSVDEDDISEVINPINTDFLKIEAYGHTRPDPQTPSQIENLHDTLCEPNIWNAIKALIANPMDGIISLIGMYDGLWNNPEDDGLDHRTIPAILGIELTGCSAIRISNCNMEKDLGYVNIDPYFDNYTDITERVLSIYLPFVGEIPLNVRDFNNRKIRLKVRTECMTGIIIYNIYTPELDEDGNPKYDGDKELLKLIKSVSGNCAIEIPIKSDIKTGLLRNLAGGNWTF